MFEFSTLEILGGLGFAISSANLFLTQFRKPRYSISIGPHFHMYHPSNGGTAFMLPMIVTNESPRRGTVYRVGLRITTPEGLEYFLSALREVRIAEPLMSYETLDRAKPFTVDSYSSVATAFWFNWPEGAGHDFSFTRGRYTIVGCLWSKNGDQPDLIKEETVDLSHETEEALKQRRKDKDGATRIHYFNGHAPIGSCTKAGEVKQRWHVSKASASGNSGGESPVTSSN